MPAPQPFYLYWKQIENQKPFDCKNKIDQIRIETGRFNINTQAPPSYINPLKMAAEMDLLNAVKALVKHGADADLIDPEDDSKPLLFAIGNRNLEMAEILIES